VALTRGLARRSGRSLGNFWVDVVRCTLYVLLPICFMYTLFLVWQGVPQNLNEYTSATTLDGATQTIAQGPVASQEAIKMLGTTAAAFSTPTQLTHSRIQRRSAISSRSCRSSPLGPGSPTCSAGWLATPARVGLSLP
jgi:Potassium-transporting ATPase A subunit